jgi:predicted O-methyltransferase YrrM
VSRAGNVLSLPRRILVRAAKETLRGSSRGKPVPLATLSRVRRLGGRTNILTFRTASVVRQGTALANPYLAEHLAERRFGDWTISAQAMNLIEQAIRVRPPRRVLEFGSGLSTACLARYMVESAPEAPRPAVISVEENADFCTEAGALVGKLGLADTARVHHAPLLRKDVAGRSVNVYDLPAEVLAELASEPPDLVFIDGPGKAGGRFSRWAVLHMVLPLLPNGFCFYLDDALSDSALDYGRLWDEIPGVEVAGVALVGHGVLVGRYRP